MKEKDNMDVQDCFGRDMLKHKQVTDFENEVLKVPGVVLVDFYTTRCGPCMMMMPILEKLSAQYNIVKVNGENDIDLSMKYNVQRVPTLIFFKNGQEVYRTTGMTKAETLESIFKSLEK